MALTVATEAGEKSTLLPVDNPYYFYDGWGIFGYVRADGETEVFSEGGDTIMVAGQTAVIKSINYDNKTLTLDRPLTWAENAAVQYAYEGSAPSVGVTLPVATVAGTIPEGEEPEIEPIPPTPVGNLIANGTFGNGQSGWLWYTAGAASFAVIDGTATVNVTESGGNTQLYQTGIPIVEGETYLIEVSARAEREAGQFLISLHEHEAPYTGLGLFKSIPVTPQQTAYQAEFVATGSSNNGRLRFAFEETNQDLYLDNVSLMIKTDEEGEGGDPPTVVQVRSLIRIGAQSGVTVAMAD